MDLYKLLNITLNPDGTLTRGNPLPNSPPTGFPNSVQSQTVASIDIPLNTTNKTWIRVFHSLNIPSNIKLPIIIYFHGGGFIRNSAASAPFHEACVRMADHLRALILSVEYRLAPEHRLPAAYEDAVDAMLWLKNQSFHGLHEFCNFVDYTKCFLMGSSSGANIAYQAGLLALNLDLEPVKIIGLILNQPFLGAAERTESELKNVNDPVLPSNVTDLMWELALPIGANRDHEYCNLILKGSNHDGIKRLPRCYVNGHGGDPLVDAEKKLVRMLQENGVCVVAHFFDGGHHGVEMFDPDKARLLMMDLKDFIYLL